VLVPQPKNASPRYLASPLSQWVTGHLLVVDGGQSLRGLPLYLENLIAPSEIAGLVL